MSTQPLIMFPYSGFESGSERERIFWKIVETCYGVPGGGGYKPFVVLNHDTENRGGADAFLKNQEQCEAPEIFRVWPDKHPEHPVEVFRVWSTDTCQMWLAGWGHIIDTQPEIERIVLLPGDIDYVARQTEFFGGLRNFIAADSRWDIMLGDFHTDNRFSAKELIDVYGTYALLANWFPEVSGRILSLPLQRPRTEFVNIKKRTLEDLLQYRKFAYEQTLNMLVRSWDFENEGGGWKYQVTTQPLGTLRDDRSFRRYRDCLDQIERTERMLKLLWREIYYDPHAHRRFIDDYDQLDRRSTSIRMNAMIAIRTFLEEE